MSIETSREPRVLTGVRLLVQASSVIVLFAIMLSLRVGDALGEDVSLLDEVVDTLRRGITLDEKYHDHELTGNYKGFRECHVKPDWLLIYLIEGDILTLTLVDTGTHSDLFKK